MPPDWAGPQILCTRMLPAVGWAQLAKKCRQTKPHRLLQNRPSPARIYAESEASFTIVPTCFSLSFSETIAMSVPVICPHCYKNIPGPTAGSDGLVHCDACGHAFPPAGASVGNSAPPAYKPLP